MQIINLVENELGDSGCEAAHGLSFYIETENHKLLFDTSPSELVLRNAEKLGVDLKNVDTVILSHGHYDHSGGILPFVEINPWAKIYMQHNAGGEYYAFDGEEKGYRYIGIDKKEIISRALSPYLRGAFRHFLRFQLRETFRLPVHKSLRLHIRLERLRDTKSILGICGRVGEGEFLLCALE